MNVDDADNPVLKNAFLFMCRHLVGLVGRIDPVDAQGRPTGPPSFFGFSGQVLSVRDHWFWLTAGHLLKRINGRLHRGDAKMKFYLADHFGPDVICRRLVDFDYRPDISCFLDEDGLDFGLVSLRPYFRGLLEANGIVPITEENWMQQHKVDCDRHIMLGFPTLFIESNVREVSGGYELEGGVSPTLIWVTKLANAPEDAPPSRFERFVGQLREGGLADIDDMSGCPIFGFQKGRDDSYWIVAIQGEWFPQRRIVFATPLPVIGGLIEEMLADA